MTRPQPGQPNRAWAVAAGLGIALTLGAFAVRSVARPRNAIGRPVGITASASPTLGKYAQFDSWMWRHVSDNLPPTVQDSDLNRWADLVCMGGFQFGDHFYYLSDDEIDQAVDAAYIYVCHPQ